MNRRQFFGMTAAAVAAAGLSPLVLPQKTLFLPPRGGWKPAQLGTGYMREVQQYLINIDEIRYRYDAVGRDIWGGEHQFRVECDDADADTAALRIESQFRHEGLIAIHPSQSREFRLTLPHSALVARYI